MSGTLVLAENGVVEIQNLRVDDRVWSYSMQAGQWQLQPVEATPARHYRGDVITVSVGDAMIETTGNHPFWVVSGEFLSSRPPSKDVSPEEVDVNEFGRWVEARNLKIGDELLLWNNETAKISLLSERQADLWVYNLNVSGNHTYAVSQLGVLVHNTPLTCKVNVQNGGKTYQTYTKVNPDTGEVYSGRTSGTGTPEENVANRDAGHHMNDKGFGPAQLDKSSANPDAIRGREQQLIEANGGAKSSGGTSGNEINGISPSNAKRPIYINAANKEF